MNGFTDLRPSVYQENQSVEESFWPSFTDLMMVVVMIFLVTTSALYMRNWQLVQEMSAMIQSERMAREVAQKTLAKQSHKDDRLDQANAELLAISEQKANLALSLTDAQESLRALTMMRNALKAQNNRKITELSAANSSQQQLLAQLNSETQRADSANAELSAVHQQLLQAQQAQSHSGQSLEELKIDFDATTDRLVQLRADYTVLKGKYDKLLRPARSPKDRFVVTLRHGKIDNNLYFDFRLPSDTVYHRVSEEEMHQRLNGVLSEHGDRLYLKLVYPESSGLSYEEAYSFRTSVLPKYDYYYRDQPLSLETTVEQE